MKKEIVYIASGFHGTWKKKIKKLKNIEVIDPEDKKDLSIPEICTWDLHGVKKSDIVFVYVNSTNPGGQGLCVKAGYGKALNKTVILVLEKAHPKYRYFRFLEGVS
ncbi:hypothetical protein K9M42_02555, partial [Patescibacteria group bacterium]|nr:hypothetical protein [Patescibacteria group bacterium]